MSLSAAFAGVSVARPSDPSPEAAAAAWMPFEPVRLDPWAVVAANRLCRRRAPLAGMVEGLSFTLRTEPRFLGAESADASAGARALDLVWSLETGEAAVLTLPRHVVERLLAAVEPGLAEVPPEPARSLLIELALAPWLPPLEGALGTRLTLVETGEAPHPSIRPSCHFVFAGDLDGVPFEAVLRVGSRAAALERLTRAVAARPTAAAAAGALAQVPFDLAIEAGTMRLRVKDLSALRPGDVLVPDHAPVEHAHARVVVGRRAAPARIEGACVRLQDGLQRLPSPSGGISMTKDDRPSGADDAAGDSTLGDLDVAVVFELGRCQVDLATLSSIAPGYVFPLARDPSGPVDILANGRRIGRAEIVRVGETLGMRVTRLFGHE